MFRARRFGAQEALRLGLVHSAHETPEALEAELAAVCADIAANVGAMFGGGGGAFVVWCGWGRKYGQASSN